MRELHLLPAEAAGIQVEIIVAVLDGEFAVEGGINRLIHYLYGAPQLLDGIVAAFFLVVGAYDAVGAEVSLVFDEVVRVGALHAFIGQYPEESADAAGVLAHHFPIVIQSGTMTAVVEAMQEFGGHEDFGQAHVVLTLAVGAVVHGFEAGEVSLGMDDGALLRVVFVEFAVEFGVPAFFVAVAPPDDGRVVDVAFYHAFDEARAGGGVVLAVPAAEFIHDIEAEGGDADLGPRAGVAAGGAEEVPEDGVVAAVAGEVVALGLGERRLGGRFVLSLSPSL